MLSWKRVQLPSGPPFFHSHPPDVSVFICMKVELVCPECEKKYLKDNREVNRNKRKGRQSYCSRSCAGKNSVNHLQAYWTTENGERLRGYSRKDEFSPYRYHLKNARNRGHECDLDLAYLMGLWEGQGGKCALSGIGMNLSESTAKKNRSPIEASLDRVDSTKGYLKGNVQFVCYFINLGKSIFSNEEVTSFLEKLKSV